MSAKRVLEVEVKMRCRRNESEFDFVLGREEIAFFAMDGGAIVLPWNGRTARHIIRICYSMALRRLNNLKIYTCNLRKKIL